MKERYVKLLKVFCWILVGVISILVGCFWYLIETSTKESQVFIQTERAPEIEWQTLDYEYWSTKTGSKYYPVDCMSSPNIPEERKIYYSSSKEARQYGKELSVRCQ